MDSDSSNLKQRIEQDLKTALLAGDKDTATTLRGLKSVILNAEIASGKRDSGLENSEVINLLGKEAKKRQESADMYVQGKEPARADAELKEKSLIEKYLPAQLPLAEVEEMVDKTIAEIGANQPQQLGQVIAAVKQKAGSGADGAVIADLVKKKLL